MHKRYCIVIYKEIVTESFAVTDMTTVTSVSLLRSESNGYFSLDDFDVWAACNWQNSKE